MAVFQVWRTGDVWENVELPHATVEALFEDLRKDGCVCGERLITKATEDKGAKRVVSRIPAIYTLRGFEKMEVARVRMIEGANGAV